MMKGLGRSFFCYLVYRQAIEAWDKSEIYEPQVKRKWKRSPKSARLRTGTIAVSSFQSMGDHSFLSRDLSAIPRREKEGKGLSQFDLRSRQSDSSREQGWLQRRETGRDATGYRAVTVLRVKENREQDRGGGYPSPERGKRRKSGWGGDPLKGERIVKVCEGEGFDITPGLGVIGWTFVKNEVED